MSRMTEYRQAVNGYVHAKGVACNHDSCVPVVVLNPEDRWQVERLTAAVFGEHAPNVGSRMAVPDFQRGLRNLLLAPKPDEPQGLGAVVEDEHGDRWIRWEIPGRHPKPWCWPGAIKPNRGYEEIDAVRVLSEGVVA